MDIKQLYDYVLDQSLAVALRVDDNDMDKPTPDSGWTVHDLMQHVMTELVWIPDIMVGKSVDEVGSAHEGDLLGNDACDSWRLAVNVAREAVQQANLESIAHLSYADMPIGDYLPDSANDILIHTWDLGQAVGVSVVFDEGVAQQLYSYVIEHASQIGASGLFKAAVEVPDSANTQVKLLALLGRSEDWKKTI